MSAHVHDPNLYWQWAQKCLADTDSVCRRGGDLDAAHLLLDEEACTMNLPTMLAEWDGISALADILVTGRASGTTKCSTRWGCRAAA